MLLTLQDFSVKQIADSGQCFRINQISDKSWHVASNNKEMILIELGNNKYEFKCSQQEFETIWCDYFDLRTDYNYFKQIILENNDPYIVSAMYYGAGLRILKQDLFESIINFIISQNNNIARIKNIIKNLCMLFNNNFPTVEQVYILSIDDFKNIGAGYRAQYLYQAIQKIYSGEFNLDLLKTLNYINSIQYLKTLSGIGDKVANCITLYGLHHMNAFPRDVWINKIISDRYKNNFNITPYQEFIGIVQQYMFYYERSKTTNKP